MPDYSKLDAMAARVAADAPDDGFAAEIIPFLVDGWLREYLQRAPSRDVIETEVNGFAYLFDVKYGRLIAAWGVSRGRHAGARDRSRMAGHPLSAGRDYHRGHAIPHTLGGPTDINLVPQLGSVNVGAFRPLEREAVATPGTLYFTHWIYARGPSQQPERVEQGLLHPGGPVRIERHGN